MTSGDRMPQKCLRMNDEGELPTCTQVGNGEWVVDYPSSPSADGVGAAIGVMFVLALLVGLAVTLWKVSTARRMARESGMNEGDATAMALLTDDGFEATYLASNLRGQQAPAPTPTPPARDAASRLRELDELRQQGLISEEEHAERRRQVLDSL